MARVTEFKHIEKERPQVHGVVECTCFTAEARDGSRYLTFETYGHPNRKHVGKANQCIQVDTVAAEKMIGVLQDFLDKKL